VPEISVDRESQTVVIAVRDKAHRTRATLTLSVRSASAFYANVLAACGEEQADWGSDFRVTGDLQVKEDPP